MLRQRNKNSGMMSNDHLDRIICSPGAFSMPWRGCSWLKIVSGTHSVKGFCTHFMKLPGDRERDWQQTYAIKRSATLPVSLSVIRTFIVFLVTVDSIYSVLSI